MILYGLKNCDNCRKALSQLSSSGHQVVFVDIRTDPLNALQIADLLENHGDGVLVNRQSATWRKLDEATRALPPHTLLAQNHTLIKRPIIFTDAGSFVGWTRDVQIALGL